MEKYYEEWDGKKFPVVEVMFEVCDGMETMVKVADVDLWDAIEEDYNNGNSDAHALDDDIYFYCDYGFIASNPTDEDIVEYLIYNGC